MSSVVFTDTVGKSDQCTTSDFRPSSLWLMIIIIIPRKHRCQMLATARLDISIWYFCGMCNTTPWSLLLRPALDLWSISDSINCMIRIRWKFYPKCSRFGTYFRIMLWYDSKSRHNFFKRLYYLVASPVH
jgi:hypothetical protein